MAFIIRIKHLYMTYVRRSEILMAITRKTPLYVTPFGLRQKCQSLNCLNVHVIDIPEAKFVNI